MDESAGSAESVSRPDRGLPGEPDRARPGAHRFLGLGLFLIVVLRFGVSAVSQYRPLTYLPGDCPYYAATAVSLLHDRDIDLRNQLNGGLQVHGKQIALGQHDAWYPKHPLLMPIAALPLLASFGLPGLLAFNVIVLGLLAVVMMMLARNFAPAWAAGLAALVLVTATFLRRYDYNFSPDLFATLILMLGVIALVRRRDATGGLMMGLAVAAKLTHLFLLPLGLLYALWCRGWSGVRRFAAGTAGPLLALGLLNLALFGSPLVTSYDRNVVLQDGALFTAGHRGLFDNDLLTGLTGELFDLRHGLLPTSPVLLLALPGLALLFRRHAREAVLFICLAEFLILLFATYRFWATSQYGNRFLMPVVTLAAPAIAMTFAWIGERVRGYPRHPRRGAAPAESRP